MGYRCGCDRGGKKGQPARSIHTGGQDCEQTPTMQRRWGGASKREQITTQSSGTKTEMAGMKRDREREPSRDVRQEEAKRNTERRQQERLKRQSTHGELQKNRERQKGHRENKKRKGETDAEKLLDVR